MRRTAEKEIIEKFGINGFVLVELKQKIKNLHCTYNQECLKIKKSKKLGAGTEDLYIPSIKWFQAFDEIRKKAKGENKTACSVETNTSQFTNSLEEDEELETVDELHASEGQSGNTVLKTPSLDKPPAPKRNKVDNLTKAVKQLREVSKNIQDNSCNEHEAFGNFVTATLNNLQKSNALRAQHDIQGILLKYKLADVGSPQHNLVAQWLLLNLHR